MQNNCDIVSSSQITPKRVIRVNKVVTTTSKSADNSPRSDSDYIADITFTPVVGHPEFEISESKNNVTKCIDYHIRRVDDHSDVPIIFTEDGYAAIKIDRNHLEFLHIIVANTLRTKSHPIARRSYEYVDTLPDGCVDITEVNGYTIAEDRYKFDPLSETVYLKCARGGKWKVVNPVNSGTNRNISLQKADGVHRQFTYKTFLNWMRQSTAIQERQSTASVIEDADNDAD